MCIVWRALLPAASTWKTCWKQIPGDGVRPRLFVYHRRRRGSAGSRERLQSSDFLPPEMDWMDACWCSTFSCLWWTCGSDLFPVELGRVHVMWEKGSKCSCWGTVFPLTDRTWHARWHIIPLSKKMPVGTTGLHGLCSCQPTSTNYYSLNACFLYASTQTVFSLSSTRITWASIIWRCFP